MYFNNNNVIIPFIYLCLIYHRAYKCWFLVPIFAPFIGATIGVMVYQLMVGFHVEGEMRDKAEASIEEAVKLNDVTTTKGDKNGTLA